jgi:hypothetical protein
LKKRRNGHSVVMSRHKIVLPTIQHTIFLR